MSVVFQSLAIGNRLAPLYRERLGEMTLRIQRIVESELVVFKLTGRIKAEDVPELLTLLRSESPGSGLLMDLTDVKLVDHDAIRFLAKSEAGGAGLRNCSGYIREWITQERSAMSRNKTEDSAEFAE
jgi:hypothetical protein